MFSVLKKTMSTGTVSFGHGGAGGGRSIRGRGATCSGLFSSGRSGTRNFVAMRGIGRGICFRLPLSLLGHSVLLNSTIARVDSGEGTVVKSGPARPVRFHFRGLGGGVYLSTVRASGIDNSGSGQLGATVTLDGVSTVLRTFSVSTCGGSDATIIFSIANFFINSGGLVSPFSGCDTGVSEKHGHSASFRDDGSFISNFGTFGSGVSIQDYLDCACSLAKNDKGSVGSRPLATGIAHSVLLLSSIPCHPQLVSDQVNVFPAVGGRCSTAGRAVQTVCCTGH